MNATIIKPITNATGAVTSDPIDITHIRFLTFTGELSGSTGPTASVKLQVSNWAGSPNYDLSNIPNGSFVDVSGASLPFTADAVKTTTPTQVCYRFARFVYATSGGTPGTFSCTALIQDNR